ncbi:MAG: class A beta-lactamase-related serine hydrolase [Bacteroidetes bacterium]|nr:MAG: class A beta-lactamase-related serine hydrolase [Bacteroidota bacterium]
MRYVQKLSSAVFLLLVGASVGAQSTGEEQVRQAFRQMIDQEEVHNGVLQMQSADSTLNWTFVGGAFQDGAPLSERNPFHAASVGKTVTAAVVMKLVEAGKLELDDSIAEHLPPAMVSGLHLYAEEDYSQKITIAQLLQHTSGLPDYIMDMPHDGSPNMMTLALQNPHKSWEVADFLTFTKEKLKAHFPPGQGYYYTDTDYVLLGLIIEAKYQKALHQVYTEELFKPLEMHHTAMFKRSQAIMPSERMAELYVERDEISTYESLTIDWAGGGLVTTTEDLLKFGRALFSGAIVSQASLDRMQDWYPESEGIYYGLGLRKFEFSELASGLPPLTIIGHSGASASFLFYCPELQLYVAGTFNQTTQMRAAIEFLVTTLVTLKFNHYNFVKP